MAKPKTQKAKVKCVFCGRIFERSDVPDPVPVNGHIEMECDYGHVSIFQYAGPASPEPKPKKKADPKPDPKPEAKPEPKDREE